MTPEELKAIKDAEEAHAKKNEDSTPGALGAAGAGALSGATFGLSGNVGPLAEYSTRAQQAHPGAYAAGYVPGAVGGTYLGGALLGAGGKAIQSAPKISKIFEGISNALKGGLDSTYESVKSGTNPSVINAARKVLTKPSVQQTVPRVVAPVVGPEPQPLPAGSYGAAEEDKTPGSFGKLANFLAQAKDSTNPEVAAAAEAAQQNVDPNDPDAKRKIAMALQATPAGRAVGNSDSTINEA